MNKSQQLTPLEGTNHNIWLKQGNILRGETINDLTEEVYSINTEELTKHPQFLHVVLKTVERHSDKSRSLQVTGCFINTNPNIE